MHPNFRAAILAKSIERAFEHTELQHDPEALASWARETFGATVEGVDPMLTIAYQALERIAEAQHLQAQRSHPRKRKSEPDKKLPHLPWCWLAHDEGEDKHDHNQGESVNTSALLGTYASCRLPFLCHKECLEHLVYAGFTSEIRFTGREGYAPCAGCGYPLAGPSAIASWTRAPLFIPRDIAEIFYRTALFTSSSNADVDGHGSRGKSKTSLQQTSLFDLSEGSEGN